MVREQVVKSGEWTLMIYFGYETIQISGYHGDHYVPSRRYSGYTRNEAITNYINDYYEEKKEVV